MLRAERAEKNPPVINANGTYGVRSLQNDIMPSTTNITAKNTATITYCLLRYALAPVLIDLEIFFIVSVPSENLSTFFAVRNANKRAMREPTKVDKIRYFSKKSTSFNLLDKHYIPFFAGSQCKISIINK